MKYSERLVDKIARLVEEDYYTITEICKAFKLSTKTFYEWKKTRPEFCKAIEEAEDRRDEALATLARHSLREQLDGYIEVTERFVYEDDGWGSEKLKSRIVTKKKRAPKAHILRLALERQDKNREKRKQQEQVNPSEKPIIMNVPKSVDPVGAIQSVVKFKEKMRSMGLPDRVTDTVKDEGDHLSVVV